MMVLVISFKFLQEYFICILFSVRIVKKILAAVNKDSLFVLNNPGKQGDSHAVGKVSLFCNLEKNIIYITHNKQNLYVNTIGGNCHSRNYDKGKAQSTKTMDSRLIVNFSTLSYNHTYNYINVFIDCILIS